MAVGIKRMLKYITFCVQRMYLFGVAFVAFMVLYLGVVAGDFQKEIGAIPLLFLAMGGLIEAIFTMGYIPLISNGVLSMGATRKELSIGVIFGFALLAVEMSITGVLTYVLVPNALGFATWQYAISMIGLNLAVAGVGILIALLIEKFGKVAYYIAVIIIALCGGIIGGVGSMYLSGVSTGRIIFDIKHIFVIVAVIGVAIYCVAALLYALGTRKKVVNV